MRTSQLASALAGATLAAGLGIAGAVPASAFELSEGCQGMNGGAFDGAYIALSDDVPLAFNAGEQFSVTGLAGTLTLEVPIGTTVDTVTGPGTLIYHIDQDGSITFTWRTSVDPGGTTWTTSCEYVGLGESRSDSAAPESTPAWVQAYGRASRDATCDSGWGQSWQEWAAAITGGWVCTRTGPSLG